MKKAALISILALCQIGLLAQIAVCQESQKSSIIALPAKQYLLDGAENKMFVQTFTKQTLRGGDVIRFEGDANYDAKGGRLERYAALKEPNEGGMIEVKLYDGDTFEVKESKSSVVCVGDPTVDSGEVTIQLLGDSFTKGCYFRDAFIDQGYVPNAKLIGTRIVPNSEGYFHEGRGGWSLFSYFSNNTSSKTFYNPYYQPDGDVRYWGSVEFWETAVSLNKNGGEGLPFYIRYDCGDYDTSRFGDDGFLLSPTKKDLMYSISRGEYLAWNGKKWTSAKEPKEWGFDYGKYLDMWGFEAPDFLIVMLGLNDFRDEESLPIDFEEWNDMVERLLQSYTKAAPNGRLLLSTPCTSCGTLNNESGAFTTRQNRVMWYVRENIIETFDGREDERLYVVDASATIDNENGYNTKGGIQTGNPHPYPNYPQLGVPLAACVQYYRNK